MLAAWNDLPEWIKNDEVKEYYQILYRKRIQLCLKRIFDMAASLILLLILWPFMIIIAVAIIFDSKGGALYRQERVTQNGRIFRIHKFRTMVNDADKKGTNVTVGNDSRITGVGAFLRRYRLDELPQLIDVVCGDMTFVGTRPEAVKYVKRYTPEMMATLLLPAGITSEASIRFKDEAKMLEGVGDADEVYVRKVLPLKMKYNLESIRKFSLLSDLKIMIRTVMEVM